MHKRFLLNRMNLLFVLAISFSSTFVCAFDLPEIRQRGVLRHLGVPYAAFVTGAGDGFDVELTRLFAQHLGVRYEYVKADWGTLVQDLLGKSVTPRGEEVEFGEAVPRRGDIIANGFTVLPWRRKIVKFSQPTFPSQIWLLTRADSPVRPIKPSGKIARDIEMTRALMNGRTVLTIEKTCLDPGLYELRSSGASLVCFSGHLNELAPAVLNGDAEMSILDVPDALIALEKWPGKLKIIGPVSERQLMASAFSPDSPQLLATYNRFLRKVKKNGVYQNLVRKYYPSSQYYFPTFFRQK